MVRAAKQWPRAAAFAAVASTTFGWSAAAQAPEASSPLAPLAFLAGHCWKGPFPDGKRHDEHCFEWFYDGKFLRDRHVVTETLRDGKWVEAWRIPMQRQQRGAIPANAAARSDCLAAPIMATRQARTRRA